MPVKIQLHHVLPASYSNGPGLRAVVWVQGCTLGCPGCYNPQTHSRSDGYSESVETLVNQIRTFEGIEGITISGGEPFQQTRAVSKLCQLVRQQTSLSIIVFTGFETSELAEMSSASSILAQIDVLISGRYRQENRLARDLRGSANKHILFLTPRYSQIDFQSIPEAEIILTDQGDIIYTGIDPLHSGSHSQKN